MWKLSAMQVRDTNLKWQEWKEGTQGYLLYGTNKHMALHLTINDYGNTDLKFPNFTDTIEIKALKYLTNNYNYMGDYTVNDSVVRHIKLSHSNPTEWGDTSYRKFWFKGDTLIMTPKEIKNANLRLKWLRKTEL